MLRIPIAAAAGVLLLPSSMAPQPAAAALPSTTPSSCGAGCGACLAPANTSTPNVLLIGDSISMGSYGYAWPVRQMLMNNGSRLATVQHAGGFGGGGQWASSSKMRSCVTGPYLDNRSFDVVTINAGIHDCAEYFSRISETAYSNNLRVMFRSLLSCGGRSCGPSARPIAAHVIFVTTTPVPELAVTPPSTLHKGCIDRRNMLAKAVVAEAEFRGSLSVCDLSAAVKQFCPGNYSDQVTGFGHCPIQRADGVHFFTKWPFPSGQQFTALKIVSEILPHLPKNKITCPWPNCTYGAESSLAPTLSATTITTSPVVMTTAVRGSSSSPPPPPPWNGPCHHYTSCGLPPKPLNKSVPNVLIIGDSISDSISGYGPLVRSLLERPMRYHGNCSDPANWGPRGHGQCLDAVNYPPGALAAVQHNGQWYNLRNGSFNPAAFEQSGSACHMRECIDTYLGSGGWDVISFNAGIHGCLSGQFVSDDDYASDLHAIYVKIAAALAPGGTVVFTTTTPVATNWYGGREHLSSSCIARRNRLASHVLSGNLGGKPVVVNDLHGAVTAVCGSEFKVGECPIQNGAPGIGGKPPSGGMHFNAAGRQFTALLTAQTIASALGPAWAKLNCTWEGQTSNSTARCSGWPQTTTTLLTDQSAAAATVTAEDIGILNASASCGLDSSGTTDVTQALQHCIARAYSGNLALFLPPGRYLVSDTLWVNQTGSGADSVNIVPNRFRPNTLIGSISALPARPTIVLKQASPGFGDASSLKNLMKITNIASEDINMNQAIRGIDFEIEPENPGAVALFFHGAQGGLVQDVTVRLAYHTASACDLSGYDSFAGFGGGGGAGTSHFNVEVIGGVHGVHFLSSEPTPVLGNARLINQTGTAIVCSHEQTLVIVGVHITRAANASGPTISAKWSGHQNNAQFSIVDSVIECGGSGGAAEQTAVFSSTSTYMNNVYVRGCNSVLIQPGTGHLPLQSGVGLDEWVLVHEVAQGVDCPASMADKGKVNVTMNVIYSNGERVLHGTVRNISHARVAGAPHSVLSEHNLWNETDFPSFESASTTANAKVQCGVIGDGVTDDEPALSSCLRKHQDVFLPKGYFALGKTLDLNPQNRLVGLGQTHSVLMPLSAGFHTGYLPTSTSNSSRKGQQQEPQPLIRTAQGATATLAFVGLMSWWHLPIYTLQWQSQRGLWRNNYETRVCECLWRADYGQPTTPCNLHGGAINLTVPKTQVSGTGAFVNFVSDEDILMTDHVNYRHLKVTGPAVTASNKNRLRFYMLNLEHSQAQANFEVSHAHGVDVYGIKLEGSTTIMWVRDSADINLFGLGGSGDSFQNCGLAGSNKKCTVPYDFHIPADFPPYNYSTIRIERTSPYRLVSLINNDRGVESATPHKISSIHTVPLTPKLLSNHPWPADDIPKMIQSMWSPWPGYALPPSFWSVVGEMNGTMDRNAVLSAPLDRPILWQRGWGTLVNAE